jgi:hypothetical protein
MCRAVEVSESGYPAFKNRPKSKNRINNEKLLIEIRRYSGIITVITAARGYGISYAIKKTLFVLGTA